VSIFNVESLSHEMRRRPGTRITAAAPNGLHPSVASFDGSHVSATFFPSALSGTLE